MVSSGVELLSVFADRVPTMSEEIIIEELQEHMESETKLLIKRNLESFQQSESVVTATFRRLNNLYQNYEGHGAKLFVAKKVTDKMPIACAGVGSLHGLPISEGVGELRDLVVDEHFRGQGIATRLLHRCIEGARDLGYSRLYLETSKHMINARKLFLRSGFRPVTENTAIKTMYNDLPCYFLLEKLK